MTLVLVLVAEAGATAGRPLLPLVEEAIDAGTRTVWLRSRDLPERAAVARTVAGWLDAVGGLLVASPGPGDEVAHGLHLGAHDEARPDRVTGRSCHSPADLQRAADEGCRWATLSPIFATASKPGYGPALGLAALTGAPLPVWALGGVHAGNAAGCLSAGAAGVAVMGAILGAPSVGDAVRALLDAVG